jgi:hypothetical protein
VRKRSEIANDSRRPSARPTAAPPPELAEHLLEEMMLIECVEAARPIDHAATSSKRMPAAPPPRPPPSSGSMPAFPKPPSVPRLGSQPSRARPPPPRPISHTRLVAQSDVPTAPPPAAIAIETLEVEARVVTTSAPIAAHDDARAPTLPGLRRAPTPQGSARVVPTIAIAASLLVVVAGVWLLVRAVRSPTSLPRVEAASAELLAAPKAIAAPLTTVAKPEAKVAASTATADVATTPSTASTIGTITTAPAANGLRIYIDGVCIGDAPRSVEVACGSHLVSVGSKGIKHTVDVPCGGSIELKP